MNRIFGWGTAVAGVSVLLGVVYIRAPMYRSIAKDQGSSADWPQWVESLDLNG